MSWISTAIAFVKNSSVEKLSACLDRHTSTTSFGQISFGRKMKTEAHFANGSHCVWIVFPDARSVMIYTSDSVREIKGEQVIEDPVLPGFSCPVSAFFELT